MKDMDEAGIVLAEFAGNEECRFSWSDAGYPKLDASYRFTLGKIQGDWFFQQWEARDGTHHAVVRFGVEDPELQGVLERSNVIHLVASLMEEVLNENPHACPDELVSAGAAHPLVGGVSIDADGGVVCICEALKKSELETVAENILDDRNEQDFLRGLRELAYNFDHGRVFLIAETADEKAKYAAMRPIEPRDDMDMVIEVRPIPQSDRRRPKYLRPLGAFHLSQTPRFDYDSRTLTGVSEYIGFEGGLFSHSDIWNAIAVMKRLPPEDTAQEDVRHCIDMALGDLASKTPEPG